MFFIQIFLFTQQQKIKIHQKLNLFIKNMKKRFPFYSKNDLKFRYYRDQVLKKNYIKIMMDMINKSNFNIIKCKKKFI